MATEIELQKEWKVQKGKLKQKFEYLTDNDLMFDEGKKDEMLKRLQITLGQTKDQLLKTIKEL